MISPAFQVETERLKLFPLSPEELRLYLENPAELEQQLHIPLSHEVVTERVRRAIQMKLNKLAIVGKADYPWYTYWLLVVVAVPFGAGLIGFKGSPNEEGEAEIGYGIDPAFQGQGYTTEAVRALIAWAFQTPDCRAVVARNTLKKNTASNRILQKVGMFVYKETSDALWWRIESRK